MQRFSHLRLLCQCNSSLFLSAGCDTRQQAFSTFSHIVLQGWGTGIQVLGAINAAYLFIKRTSSGWVSLLNLSTSYTLFYSIRTWNLGKQWYHLRTGRCCLALEWPWVREFSRKESPSPTRLLRCSAPSRRPSGVDTRQELQLWLHSNRIRWKSNWLSAAAGAGRRFVALWNAFCFALVFEYSLFRTERNQINPHTAQTLPRLVTGFSNPLANYLSNDKWRLLIKFHFCIARHNHRISRRRDDERNRNSKVASFDFKLFLHCHSFHFELNSLLMHF